MDNSLAANRRLALQVIGAQAAVAVAAALACWWWRGSAAAAVGALAGGLVVALGTAVMALRVFAPALAGPGATLARLAVGTLLKWIVVIVGFYLILVYWRLPAVPALIGLVAALLVNIFMLGRLRH